MKARKLTTLQRLLRGEPVHSPFTRPQTIVAIIRDKEERIDVDRFRGISERSPESVRLRRLGKYVDDLAREWTAYESGLDPVATTLTADWVRDIKRKETSETNSKSGSKKKKYIPEAALRNAVAHYLKTNKGEKRGMVKAMCAKFETTGKTLNNRIKEYRIVIPDSY